MGRGRRFDSEEKLNLKKVFAVIIAIVVIIMFFVAINTILKNGKNGLQGNTQLNYFSVYTNEKWGVINSNGDYVIEPTYDEMVVVPNKEKAVFICTYDVNYTDGTYKTKAIDANGNQLFTEYEGVEPIEDCDSNNRMWYDTNILRVQKNGKYGLINFDGKELLTCEFEDIHALKGYKNKIVTVKEKLYGLIDNTGTIVVYNECSSDDSLIQKCNLMGINLELTTMPDESENAKNIGKWHISKDDNSSYYTDSNN